MDQLVCCIVFKVWKLLCAWLCMIVDCKFTSDIWCGITSLWLELLLSELPIGAMTRSSMTWNYFSMTYQLAPWLDHLWHGNTPLWLTNWRHDAGVRDVESDANVVFRERSGQNAENEAERPSFAGQKMRKLLHRQAERKRITKKKWFMRMTEPSDGATRNM